MMLQTERLELRLPTPNDAPALLAFYERNRDHLQAWEPARTSEFYQLEHQRQVINTATHNADTGVAYLLLLVDRRVKPKTLVGIIHLNSIIRGVFQSGRLGYKLDAGAVGQGLMHEALQAVVAQAFDVFNLHRLEANYMVENHRSGAVLKKLGFDIVGMERDYLFLNGCWRDHVLTAKKNAAWRALE